MPQLALPEAAARTRPALLGVAIVASLSSLVGCGGTEPSFSEGSSAILGAQAQTPAPATRSETAAAIPAPSAAKSDAAPTQAVGLSPYDVRLDDEDGPTLELAPMDGRGYPTVRVRVVLRGERFISPVANVLAYCATPTRCEYLPPRNGDHPLKYTVSIGEDSIARLSPTGDMIAVTTPRCHRDAHGRRAAAVTRQIKYLRSAG